MYRLAYRNLGGTETMVVNHAVQIAGSSHGNPNRNAYAGVRWYEIRGMAGGSGTPTLRQQATYAPDTTFRWMGSIAMDKQGNMALGFSASSSAIKPAIRYATRAAGLAALLWLGLQPAPPGVVAAAPSGAPPSDAPAAPVPTAAEQHIAAHDALARTADLKREFDRLMANGDAASLAGAARAWQ